MPVKGRASVRVFEVLRPRGRRTRFDVAVERGLTPLVGRERELATLRERFREVKAGQGQVVGIAGEAGMGKSRLVLEFRRALAQAGEGVTWLEGHCISFGQASPFLPLIEQLRENFQIDEFDGEPEIIAKVEQGMRRMGELEAYIPAIRYLLSVDPGDTALAAMDGAARRRQLFAALRALPIRGAQLRPLVLVVEDLHWIDTSSEEFLNTMLDAVAGVPLLLLMTYRIGYTPPFGSRSFYTTLTLHSFSEAEALAMAGHVLGMKQFPAGLQTALMEKAEGVPLFIEEVTKTLLDLGVLQRENGAYRLVKSLSEVHVPDTIQGIIMARLDRLGEDGKRTVQLASVIGRQFLVRLLARIAGLSDRLEGLLRELQALEIIYEQGLLPEPAYIFKHAVIQDVAYNSLLIQRRKALHRAVGEAIEELYQDRLEEHYTELAHHFSQGEVWDKAFTYCRQAGEKAMARSAHREAVGSFEQALNALRHLPEHARHARAGHRSPARPAHGAPPALATLGVSWRVCARLRLSRRPSTIRVGWDRSLPFCRIHFYFRGAHDQAIAAAQRALALATTGGDVVLQALANQYPRHSLSWPRATIVRRSTVSGRRWRPSTGRGATSAFGQLFLPAVLSRAWLAACYAELGSSLRAGPRGRRAADCRGGCSPRQPHVCLVGGWSAVPPPRRPAQSTPPARTGLGICQDADLPTYFPWMAAALGAAYTLGGRVTDAVPLLTQAMEQTTAMGRIAYQALCGLSLGEAHLLAGRLEEAHTLAERALALARDAPGTGPPGVCPAPPRRDRCAPCSPGGRAGRSLLPPGPRPG